MQANESSERQNRPDSAQVHGIVTSLQSQLAREQAQNETLTQVIERLCDTEWRYSHAEIEAACGGEIAQQVRRDVVKRRIKILEALSK